MGGALGSRWSPVALAHGPVPAERLAQVIWGDALPVTWAVALRGVVRGLRTACRGVGGSKQHLIATAPSGYRLAAGVEVDVDVAAQALRRAQDLIGKGRGVRRQRPPRPYRRLDRLIAATSMSAGQTEPVTVAPS